MTNQLSSVNAPAGSTLSGKSNHPHAARLSALLMFMATAASSQTLSVAPSTAHYKLITIAIPGSTGSSANTVNDEGLVTVMYSDANANTHTMLWQNGTKHILAYPGAADTVPGSTNDRGLFAGAYGDQHTQHAVTYSIPDRIWNILPDVAGYPLNFAGIANNNGVLIGLSQSGILNNTVSWIWDAKTSTYSFFTVPGATGPAGTLAQAINDQGLIVGVFQDGNGVYHGFLKQGETFTTIDRPGAAGTLLTSINDEGAMAGEWLDSAGASHGFVRKPDGAFATVDVPGAAGTATFTLNNHEDLCGYWLDQSGVSHAFVAFRQ